MKLKTSTKYPKMAAKSCTQKLISHICRLMNPIKPIFFWKFSPETFQNKINKSTRCLVGGARAPRNILWRRFSKVAGTYLRRERGSFGAVFNFEIAIIIIYRRQRHEIVIHLKTAIVHHGDARSCFSIINRRAAALSIDSPEIEVYNLRFPFTNLLRPPESPLGGFTAFNTGHLAQRACPWTH